MWAGPASDPDRYELIVASAPGGEGSLWKSRLAIDGVHVDVAVKVIHASNAAVGLDEWRARWQRQAEVLKSLDHPSVVRVRDVFDGPAPHERGAVDRSTNTLFLVMNWVEGESLEDWTRSHPNAPLPQRLELIARLAAAVDYLQSGPVAGRSVLHRDIKPANVIVGGAAMLTLVDFGLVRLMHDANLTSSIGTPAYWAPEVALGDTYTDAADRYSFGATAYYVLTGQRPQPMDQAGMANRLAAVPGVANPSGFAAHALLILNHDPRLRPERCVPWANVLAMYAGDQAGSGTQLPTRVGPTIVGAGRLATPTPPPPPPPQATTNPVPPPAYQPPPPPVTIPAAAAAAYQGPSQTSIPSPTVELLQLRQRHQRRMLTMVFVGLAVLVFGGIGVALALGGGDGGSAGSVTASPATTRDTVQSSSDTGSPDDTVGTSEVSATSEESATTPSPTTLAATTTTSPAPVATGTPTTTGTIREAQIFAETVKIRSQPDPTTEDNVLVKFVPDEDAAGTFLKVFGTVIEVLGTNVDGWYHVRYQGFDGWMYGTFILPPDPELVVWQSPDENTLELLSASGVPVDFPRYDSTGDKVLVRVTGAPYRSTLPNGRQLLRVLLPDGGEAWVDEATVVPRVSFP